ncbi:FadR/GntR family transcriptional regulator [Oceanomicrobium pacificus]|uniref:FCD domain-containing protein n=1 Tax=Oceanomicrobium pacificus TaxID=2692916 RepID=A0A6B0U457_9RHOB|nr:FCD domain-containing protein [Oceanomicrobium pacificus]MXU65731.1 FCD domain-containing protein [Oceanomicrobium pacificus]
MSDTGTPKNGTTSAVDQLVDAIKMMIATEGLSVGDPLPSERELGERFNAARNTVREAVRILKAYGVIDVRPKVGAVIVNRQMDAVLNLFSFQLTLTRETFMDVQGFRRLIEVGVADALIAQCTGDDLARLAAINDSILTATSEEDAAARDFAFHAALLSIARNDTVLAVYRTMEPLICRLMRTGKQTDGLVKTHEAHAEILEALARRDRLRFQFYMSEHLDQGLKYIDGSVAPPPARTPDHQQEGKPTDA